MSTSFSKTNIKTMRIREKNDFPVSRFLYKGIWAMRSALFKKQKGYVLAIVRHYKYFSYYYNWVRLKYCLLAKHCIQNALCGRTTIYFGHIKISLNLFFFFFLSCCKHHLLRGKSADVEYITHLVSG